MDGRMGKPTQKNSGQLTVIQLVTSGRITGFDIDTNFFLGNHPPHASIEAAYINNISSIPDPIAIGWDKVLWKEILPKSHLDAGSQNFYLSTMTIIYSSTTPYLS
jgi:allantoicase